MERIKLTQNANFACNPVNTTGDGFIYPEDLINAIPFSGTKFISIKGKLYTHEAINASFVEHIGVPTFTFNEFGTETLSGPISYAELVSKIKKYGLQPFIKVSGKWCTTKSMRFI